MYLPEMLQFYNHAHPIVRNSLTLVPKPSAEWKELALIVNYMGCEACESAVRNILESRREVEMAQVDWESGHVKIYGPRVQELDLAAVTRLLEEHGYALATSQVDILSPVTIQSE
jgi:copper chaperone CopZ